MTGPRSGQRSLQYGEEAILDLWDEGFSRDQIAERLHIPVERARRVINYIGGQAQHRQEDSAARRAMIFGSEMLLAAIQRERAA